MTPFHYINGFAKSCAAEAVDLVSERWVEEYGDREGRDDGLYEIEDLQTSIVSQIVRTFKGATPWRCRKVGERTYSVDEVLEMLKDYLLFESEATDDVR